MSVNCLQPCFVRCLGCFLNVLLGSESREEPLKGPLPNLIVDFSSSCLPQDRVAVHSQDVMDTPDAKTLSTLVHRDEPTGSHTDSERVASRGHCGDRGKQTYLLNFPFRRGCVQVFDVVNGFCLLRISLCSDFVVGLIKILQTGRHQDRVAEDVTIVNVPEVCQASIFLWIMSWVVSSNECCWPAQLKI